MMAKDIFHCGSSPTASLREERNSQDQILDETVPEPTKASKAAVNVGACWCGFKHSLTFKTPFAPQVQT